MNILVIGLGSMGKRRIRLLLRMFSTFFREEGGLIAGIDTNKDRRKDIENQYSVKTYESISEAVKDKEFDVAVISTSPLSHAHIIKECLKNNLHVFTEINLVSDEYENNIQLAKDKNKVLFISSTPMYRKEMRYIKNFCTDNFKGTYRYHIGQYLPEWHPWENYKSYFVENKRSNGCRELFAIELPWLIDAFGEVTKINSIHSKISNLSLSYDDCYTVILEHINGIIGNISVDIVTPKGGRELELWGEGKYIEWKGTPETLAEWDIATKCLKPIELYNNYEHDEKYNKFVIEDAYYDELVNFIHVIDGTESAKHTFEKDKKVLSLIDEIGA